jgi:hypothetical protein
MIAPFQQSMTRLNVDSQGIKIGPNKRRLRRKYCKFCFGGCKDRYKDEKGYHRCQAAKYTCSALTLVGCSACIISACVAAIGAMATTEGNGCGDCGNCCDDACCDSCGCGDDCCGGSEPGDANDIDSTCCCIYHSGSHSTSCGGCNCNCCHKILCCCASKFKEDPHPNYVERRHE